MKLLNPHHDPEFLHGQVLALQALLLGLAGITTDRDSFREQSLLRLEALRTALLPEPVAEAKLQAIDAMEKWVLSQS